MEVSQNIKIMKILSEDLISIGTLAKSLLKVLSMSGELEIVSLSTVIAVRKAWLRLLKI